MDIGVVDPKRPQPLANMQRVLAGTNQVLVFTCQPHIVEWFAKAAESEDVELPEIIKIE